jgi:hypothetical protein
VLREKIVAESGRRLAIGIDDSKLSAKLGTQKFAPVEVVQFEWHRLADFLPSLGADLTLCLRAGGEAFVTDQGKFVLDRACWTNRGSGCACGRDSRQSRDRRAPTLHRPDIRSDRRWRGWCTTPEPSRSVTNPVGVDQLPPSHIEAMHRPVHEAAEFRPGWLSQKKAGN